MGNAQISFSLSPDHTEVLAGEDASLYLSLKNRGTKSISDVLITLDLPGQFGGQRNFTVRSLSAGATWSRAVDIITLETTEPGNYSANATVTYQGEEIEYPGVEIEVIEYPLTVTYHFLNERMKAGGENSLVISVKNTGDRTLEGVELTIDYPAGFITNMTKTLYLYEMIRNMEIRQEFAFIAPADANGDYHAGISVEFRDDERHTLKRYAKVYVEGAPTLNWLETLLTIFIVILIGLILLGRAR